MDSAIEATAATSTPAPAMFDSDYASTLDRLRDDLRVALASLKTAPLRVSIVGGGSGATIQ